MLSCRVSIHTTVYKYTIRPDVKATEYYTIWVGMLGPLTTVHWGQKENYLVSMVCADHVVAVHIPSFDQEQ